MQAGAHAIGRDQRAVAAALALRGRVADELVLEALHGRAVDGAQVAVVADVVHELLRVLVERAQVVPLRAHPGRVVPLRQAGVVPLGLAAFWVVPDEDGPQVLHHLPALDLRGGRDGALVVRDVVALAVCAEAPGVVRAADAVALDVGAGTVLDDVAGAVGRGQVRLHVRAVGVEQHHRAAVAAPVQREVLAEEAHGQGPVLIQLRGFCDHEPAAWVGEFAESIVLCLCHASALQKPSGCRRFFGLPHQGAYPVWTMEPCTRAATMAVLAGGGVCERIS